MQKCEVKEQHLRFKPLADDKKQILSDLKQQLRQIKAELTRLRLIGDELLSVQNIFAPEIKF